MPSRDFTSEDLFSSRMMSMHSSTHSSQMNTVGPAISLRTSCWLLPQKEQYRVFLESPLDDFVIAFLRRMALSCLRPAHYYNMSYVNRGLEQRTTRNGSAIRGKNREKAGKSRDKRPFSR